MSWVAVNKDGQELVLRDRPSKVDSYSWGYICVISTKVGYDNSKHNAIECFGVTPLPKGSIKKLIGRDLSWEDEAVELK